MEIKVINLPQDANKISSLKCGDIVQINGVIYTARDAAHKLMCEAIEKKQPLPFDIKNACIYYCGPTPTRKGEIIGSCGPTTSARMDDYAPTLLNNGLKFMLGKGNRNTAVRESIIKNKAVYLVNVGGAAALVKNAITACELVAYPELGCEAIYKLTVKNLQAAVAIDSLGNAL